MIRALGASSTQFIRRELVFDAMFITIIALMCASFFWRLVDPIESERMYVAGGDFVNQFVPYQQFVASELHRGRIPLWNPHILAGHPALADTQMGVSYPIGLLLNYLSGLDDLTLLDVELRLILDYFMAGTFTYLFVKKISGHRIAGLFSGIVFSFSGYLMSYPGQQAPILESALWLPLVLFFLYRGVTDRPWLPNVCIGGALQSLSILAGHPQTAMFLFYTACAYVVWLANNRGLGWRRTLMVGTTFVSIALMLAAIQLLPVLEFLPLSTRMSVTYEEASHGFELISVLGIVLPDWRNERSLYVGIVPLLLALWAICRNLPGSRFWAGAAALSLILSFGGRNPLFPVLYSWVPGFSLFRDQERIALVFTFALAVLAGQGIAGVLSDQENRSIRNQVRSILLPSGFLVLAAVAPFFTTEWAGSSSFEPGLYGGIFSGYQLLLAFVALVIVSIGCALVFMSRGHSQGALRPLFARPSFARPLFARPLFAMVIIAVAVFDLSLVNWHNNIVPTKASISADALSALNYLRGESGTFRIRIESDEVLPANYPAAFGLDHIGGDTPIRVARVQELFEEVGEWRLWQVFNVEYVVTRRSLVDGVELAFADGGVNTYRVSYGLPRAYAVTDFFVATDSAQALELIRSEENHPGDVAILEDQPSFVQPHPEAPRPEVEIVEHSAQRIRIRSRGEVDAILVVADAYYPGWRATVDEVPTTIYRADYALRAIELPAGEHIVEMAFDPSSYRLGAAITVAGWVFVLALAAHARWGPTRRVSRWL